MNKAAYLILKNGTVFTGFSFGACKEITGELVFTTGMTGYLETLTDPSYFGQMVVQTFPLIGNYGIIPSDFESKSPVLKAYIVREWCQEPSNFRCEGSLDTFLRNNGVVGLYGIDTRRLTKIVREHGVMNAKIVYELPDDLKNDLSELHRFKIVNAVESVTAEQKTVLTPDDKKYRIVLWDFGAKKNIARELYKRGCEVVIMPASSTAEQIADEKPDGILLSNGPGDPQDNTEIIRQIKLLTEYGIPMFGICLGHQLLALSQGAVTEKLRYGHRGSNQPVLERETGRVYISSQNHGYAVVSDSLPENAVLRYVNANDGTCEGIDYTDIKAFSAQFHPEAASGPKDTEFLFERFLNMVEEVKQHAVK